MKKLILKFPQKLLEEICMKCRFFSYTRNAPVHTAKDVKKWILMNKIKVWAELEKKQTTSNNKCCRIRDSITGRMGQDFTKSSNGFDRKYATENRSCYCKHNACQLYLL